MLSRIWLPVNWLIVKWVAALAILCPLLAGTAAADPTLYALLVFDTHADGIGDQMKIDRDNLTRVLFKAFDQDGHRHRLELRVLEGDEATAEKIFEYYDEIDSTEEDTLLFYYSGHGGTDPERGHFLAMAHGTVYRSDLRGALDARVSRRDVILTDCCANYAEATPYVAADNGKPADWEVAKDLFFEGTGLVDINAASPGGLSYTNTNIGSYFTASLTYQICLTRQELDTDGNGVVNWREFLKQVDNHIMREYISKDRQLSHVFYVDEVPPRFFERTLLVRNDSAKPISVHVEYYTEVAPGEWQWVSPAEPWSVPPGESSTLKGAAAEDTDIQGQQVRIWAETTDGKTSWTEHKEQDFDLVDPRFGYSASERERQVYTFGDFVY